MYQFPENSEDPIISLFSEPSQYIHSQISKKSAVCDKLRGILVEATGSRFKGGSLVAIAHAIEVLEAEIEELHLAFESEPAVLNTK